MAASFEEEHQQRLLEEQQRLNDILEHRDDIHYSARYADDFYEYRHVTLPKQIARWVPPGRLMLEEEWRNLGVQQSAGWVHYMIHEPEPHILLFKREKDFQIKYPNAKAVVAGPVPQQQNGQVGGLAG
ncbi:cyclin-dependent kinase regulatory subunit-domain-containing protein [Gaertneriomyces semiglobifer]|nr:cyclin-dependent kinase regulatory subunit-domain-containing protein [Gaertneriomyces semiglobifer]